MRFQKNSMGYLKLGIIFTVFSIIPAFIISIVGTPIIFGGLIAGGAAGLSAGAIVVLVISFFVEGWFLYWFVTSNRWK